VAALLAGDARAALVALERSRAIGGEALNDEIPWYLAAAYERAGEAAKSVELLRAMCRAEGIHREAACAALR
jgi:hypothetical protein